MWVKTYVLKRSTSVQCNDRKIAVRNILRQFETEITLSNEWNWKEKNMVFMVLWGDYNQLREKYAKY